MKLLKRGATFSSPPADPPAVVCGPTDASQDPKPYRRVDPLIFVVKLAIFADLLLIFGRGILSTEAATTLTASLVLILPPLVMAWDCLTSEEDFVKITSKLLLFTALPLAALAAAVHAGPTVLKVIYLIGLGVVLAHGTELAHQALHRTGTGRARWDHAIAAVLCRLTGISFFYYLWSHLQHHKNNGTEKDRESFDYAYALLKSPSRRVRLFGFVWHVSMIAHYVTLLRRMFLASTGRLAAALCIEKPAMSESIARKIQREYRLMAAVLLVAVLVSVALETTMLLSVWVIPVLVAWGPAHALIELSEHWECDIPNGNVFVNTRSLRAGRFARWLTNNNDAHVGHHHDMHVPMDKLEEYEEHLTRSHNFKYLEPSYLTFFGKFFRYLWTGKLERSL